MLHSEKDSAGSAWTFVQDDCVKKKGRNSNLHQRLLAIGVPIRQTETTSCAPYHEVNSISNIPVGETIGQGVRN